MKKRIVPDFENRLLTLYTLERLGPVTDTQLLRFMVDQDLMNYFTLQLGLSEMEEQGCIRKVEHPLDPLLQITSSGRAAVTEFLSKLPQSRREQVDAAAPESRARFRLEQQTPAETTRLADGKMCLRLRLLESSRTVLDLWLTLPEGAAAYKFHERWTEVYSSFYSTLTRALMSGEASEEGIPDTACIQHGRDGEYLLSLSCGSDEEPMVLLLSLPDEGTARYCAARWNLHADELHSLLLSEMLKEE